MEARIADAADDVAAGDEDTHRMTNHRLVPIVTAAAATATALAVSLALATGAHAQGSGTHTLRLTVSATRISTVDLPPLTTSKRSGATPGDEVIAVSTIGGSGTGHRYLTCAATQAAHSIEAALYACQITYRLTAGTITASGVVRLSGTNTAAITGGTGGYAGIRGTLTSSAGRDTLTLQATRTSGA